VYSRFDEGLDTPYLGAAYAVLAAA
jgi:hypothetical protein